MTTDNIEYHEHVAGDRHAHPFSGPHSHGGVSALNHLCACMMAPACVPHGWAGTRPEHFGICADHDHPGATISGAADPLRENRWERLRDLPPAEEAASHFSDADDPLDIEDLICAGCQGDWPCDFERGRRSALADEGYVVVRAEDVRTVGPLVAALTDALPNRSRDAILALGDLLRDEHGESCDCETCLPVQSLVDTALREALDHQHAGPDAAYECASGLDPCRIARLLATPAPDLRAVIDHWYDDGRLRFSASLAGDSDSADEFVLDLLAALGSATPEPTQVVWWCGQWGTLNAMRYHGNDGPCPAGNCGEVAYVRLSAPTDGGGS